MWVFGEVCRMIYQSIERSSIGSIHLKLLLESTCLVWSVKPNAKSFGQTEENCNYTYTICAAPFCTGAILLFSRACKTVRLLLSRACKTDKGRRSVQVSKELTPAYATTLQAYAGGSNTRLPANNKKEFSWHGIGPARRNVSGGFYLVCDRRRKDITNTLTGVSVFG